MTDRLSQRLRGSASRVAVALLAVVALPVLTIDLAVRSNLAALVLSLGGWTMASLLALNLHEVLRSLRSADSDRIGPLVMTDRAVAATYRVGLVLLGLGLVYLLSGIGDAPWRSWIAERGGAATTFYVLALLALVACVLAGAVGMSPSAVTSVATECASVAAVLAVICTVYSVASASTSLTFGGTYVDEGGRPIRPGIPEVSLATASDIDLLVGLAPVLLVGQDDRLPTAVDSYVSASTWSRRTNSGVTVIDPPRDLATARALCNSAAPCFVLDSRDCAEDKSCQLGLEYASGEGPGSLVREGESYGRLIRREATGMPGLSWDVTPWPDDIVGVAQWWYFTPSDSWTSPILLGAGSLEKAHLADWEHVTIGFSSDRILFVAASSHCGGVWREWADANVWYGAGGDSDPLGPGLHVKLARSDGSFGMYFDVDATRAPDFLSCGSLGGGWFRGLAYLINARDETREIHEVIPVVVVEDAARDALELPAVWSVRNGLDVYLAGSKVSDGQHGTLDTPAGPASPVYKASYIDPLHTVFCASDWRPDVGESTTSPNC